MSKCWCADSKFKIRAFWCWFSLNTVSLSGKCWNAGKSIDIWPHLGELFWAFQDFSIIKQYYKKILTLDLPSSEIFFFFGLCYLRKIRVLVWFLLKWSNAPWNLGSLFRGYYDNVEGETGRARNAPAYNTTRILRSAVSDAIREHLGVPVAQESSMWQLQSQASVQCRPNMTNMYYTNRYNFPSCNETECLFDLKIDPCETTNIAKSYPRVSIDEPRVIAVKIFNLPKFYHTLFTGRFVL